MSAPSPSFELRPLAKSEAAYLALLDEKAERLRLEGARFVRSCASERLELPEGDVTVMAGPKGYVLQVRKAAEQLPETPAAPAIAESAASSSSGAVGSSPQTPLDPLPAAPALSPGSAT